jgi:ribonuclease HII
MILGVDEVGRGAWAGPLVVGAVVLGEAKIDGLADSKKLSRKSRERLSQEIMQKAAGVGLGWVAADKIDELGLSASLKIATITAVGQITAAYHELIIDGTVNFLSDTNKGQYVTTLKKADQLIAAVSAAAIVAKVARDEYMRELDECLPGYGFAAHVGYGTALHRAALDKLGPSSEHRFSFKPLSKFLSPVKNPATKDSEPTKRTSTKDIGDQAETAVCSFLKKLGHDLVARNWRTRFFEIDIVSQLGDELYFTEVKYRRRAIYGSGLEAITPPKLKRMKQAALSFSQAHGLDHLDPCLAVADVSGDDFAVKDFVVL